MDEVEFGRYRLIAAVGKGGMGTVYRAHDTVMGRDVAIKVLAPELAVEPGYRERFQREAYAAARLTEPHIIAIHDAGEIDGRLYLTMPVIDGLDLASVLRRDGPLGPERAVAVIEQLAAALDAAHRAGLVHRDVKPSNVLVTGNGFVYLIDFGIAHEAGSTRLTRSGSVLGSWAYMAPERFNTGAADTRADVYALACVLYECLTGELPYPGDSLEQQIAGHLTGAAPRPSLMSGTVPTGFDEVIAHGMAKDPAQRFQTATQLAAAARHALTRGAPPGPPGAPRYVAPGAAQAPTVAAPTSAWHPGASGPVGPAGSRRSRTPWLIGAAAAAVVALLLVVVAIVGRKPDTTATPAAQPSSSPSASTAAPSESVPPTPPALMVAPEALDSIVLGAADISAAMGATLMFAPGPINHATWISPYTLSEPDCSTAAYVAQTPAYQASGYTAISHQALFEQGPNAGRAATQVVVAFPSQDQALAFVATSADTWRSCGGRPLVETFNGLTTRSTFGSVVGAAPTIAQLRTEDGSSGYGCQHTLHSVFNVVLEALACGPQITDQGDRIAQQLAGAAERQAR